MIFSGLALGLSSKKASAMPAGPHEMIVTQPDGTEFLAQPWGDERASGLETAEGYSIGQQDDGWWVYKVPESQDGLSTISSLSELRVEIDSAPDVALQIDQISLEQNPQKFLQSVGGERPSQDGFDSLPPLSPNNPAPMPAIRVNTGSQPVLVILTYFDDRSSRTNIEDFQNKFFGPAKSVKDYYAKASYNLVQLVPAAENSGTANDGIVGWLNLGPTHPNPGNTNWTATRNIVSSALQKADKFVNFAAFDKDGNNSISAHELHIVIIVAGYEASYDGGAAKPNVWGHEWFLGVPVQADGVSLCAYNAQGSYTMFGEMMGNHSSTIGIMVHEMGHDFGWPDLYSSTSGAGLGTWDIMSFGGWSTGPGDSFLGETPPMPSAYLRMLMGWIDPNNPQQLIHALDYQNTPIVMPSSSEEPFALMIPTDQNPSIYSGEFFIAENRQQIGYDASLPGAGGLVWHIDESVFNNNDPLHPRIRLVQADGADHLKTAANYGDPGDAFSASSLNTRFGVGSALSSNFYNGQPSNVILEFGSGNGPGFASMMTSKSITVTASLAEVVIFDPSKYPHHIYLPIAVR
ncbi:MAG: M6 family metalloprotease domain-containing protein [Anaerolineaceae bacterium]|nr:M6 family metalloprotease domain-containing protein [Anaerolineaceae bacterium]